MRRAVLPVVAALLGAAAAAGAVDLLASPQAPTPGPNVFVNPPGFVHANNSPSVAANPVDARNLVVVNRVDRPVFTAALHASVDGGVTWRSTTLPLPPGEDRPFGPDAAFAPDGTLHVVYVNLTGRGNTPEALWIARSNDGGQTLSQPFRVSGRLAFQAQVVVDPRGTVHVTWLQATDVGLLALRGPARVVAVRSADGGRTFSAPVPVSDAGRPLVGAATPVVTAGGDLVVLYEDFRDDVRDFGNLEGPPWPKPFALVVTRSTDAGRSFSPGVEVDGGLVADERFLAFLPAFPSVAAGPDGALVVAWSDARSGDEDVYLRRSRDGGRTWGRRIRVNDNPDADGTDQFLPTAAVAEGGRVDVVFLDGRNDPRGMLVDAYLATSEDGGETFRNVRLSPSFSSRIGSSAAPHLPPDLGSRLGVASLTEHAHAVWTDTRLGTEASGRQDIVTARVDLPDPDALAVRRGLVLASILAAGAVLLAWRTRRPARPGGAGARRERAHPRSRRLPPQA